MNSILPASIISYLQEAGFSAIEMLVLKKLVEEDSVTIRELATKTGKSGSVLDQTMKKFLARKIARKEIINGLPRYSITSLDTIVQSMNEELMERREQMDRRHQDFTSFVASLTHDKHRPDMEHFHGLDGIQKAYTRLLDTGQELLTFTPILTTVEDDPLRALRVESFRKRQCRKIFQRVLAPDTPLARRFRSRDMFEYRQTLLLPASDHPMAFERTIVDGVVACIDLQKHTGCFLKFPEFAAAERATFEALWKRTLADERTGGTVATAVTQPVIPLSTKILSTFRQFFLGKRSLIALVIFAIVSAVLTFGLYSGNRELNLQRLKDKLISIAITGALQFDVNDVNAIWGRQDIYKPEYAKLIATLNLIRRNNTNIQYSYIMRATNDPYKWKFVADADSLNPTIKKDINGDGKIDVVDQLSYPGDVYDISSYPWSLDAFQKPIVDPKPITDQWGTLITSTAPIRNSSGEAVAVFGIDMFASNLDRLSASSFTPLYAFIGFFLLFMLIRFWSENRSLMEECFEAMKRNLRKTLLWILFIPLFAWAILYGFGRYQYHLLVDQTGQRLMAIAATAANEFDPNDLNQLHWARDMKTEAYQRVFKKLNEIRNKNPDVKYVYIYRPTSTNRMYEFVADADSNYNLPLYTKNELVDENMALQNLSDPADQNAWPGLQYFDAEVNGDFFDRAMIQPTYGVGISQWGYSISAMAPMYDSNKKLIGFLGLDIAVSEIGK